MIKIDKGSIEINGDNAVVVAEIMCLMSILVKDVLIPKWGSRKWARREMSDIVDGVFEMVESDGGSKNEE